MQFPRLVVGLLAMMLGGQALVAQAPEPAGPTRPNIRYLQEFRLKFGGRGDGAAGKQFNSDGDMGSRMKILWAYADSQKWVPRSQIETTLKPILDNIAGTAFVFRDDQFFYVFRNPTWRTGKEDFFTIIVGETTRH